MLVHFRLAEPLGLAVEQDPDVPAIPELLRIDFEKEGGRLEVVVEHSAPRDPAAFGRYMVVASSEIDFADDASETIRTVLLHGTPTFTDRAAWHKHLEESGILDDDPDSVFVGLPYILPRPIRAACYDFLAFARSAIRRTVHALRWYSAAEYPPGAATAETIEWSLDGVAFSPIPLLGWSVRLVPGIRPCEVVQDELVDAVNRTEPLAHELLREARASRDAGQLRSALVLALSAAEVGLKSAISARSPEVQWLVESMASPPVVKLAARVSRQAVERGEPELSKRVKRALDVGMQARNQLVHLGIMPISAEKLAEVIACVSLLLYWLDAGNGLAWAARRVQQYADFPPTA